MSKVLGIPGYDYVTIAHPVSSAADAELAAMAADTIKDVRRILLRA